MSVSLKRSVVVSIIGLIVTAQFLALQVSSRGNVTCLRWIRQIRRFQGFLLVSETLPYPYTCSCSPCGNQLYSLELRFEIPADLSHFIAPATSEQQLGDERHGRDKLSALAETLESDDDWPKGAISEAF